MEIPSLDKQGKNFSLTCSKHNNLPIEFILVKQKVEENLICFKCMQEDGINPLQVINTKELIDIPDECILLNFPPLEDENLSKYLKDLNNKENQINIIEEDINKYYSQLRIQIEQKIQEKENKTDQQLKRLKKCRSQIMEVYDEISQKFSLSQIINNYEENKIKEIQQIIDEKFDKISQNTSKIQEKIQQFRILKDSLNKDAPDRIKKDIVDILEKIDFFCETDFDSLKNLIQLQENDSLCNDKISKKSSIDIILELVKNPTNYCSQQYINSLQEQLNKYRFILNKINIDDQIICDFEKKNVFCSLNMEQLENVRELSQQILDTDKSYQNQVYNNELYQKIQFNSYSISNILDKSIVYDNENLKKLLKKYPIFETVKKVQLNQISSLNLVKSQYAGSQYQTISRTSYSWIEIQKSNESIYPNQNLLSYTDFNLVPTKKYVFRIKIQSNSKNDTFINVGLIKDNTKDVNNNQKNKLIQTGLGYIESGNEKGICKVIKGGNVFEGNKANIDKEIEMRIDLQNKILKVANYPNYENVAELDDKSKIQENQEYRFATELYYQEHKIIITNFAIVDEFDNKMDGVHD